MSDVGYVTRRECEITHKSLIAEITLLREDVANRLDKIIEGQTIQNGAIAANTKWRVQGQIIVGAVGAMTLVWGAVILGVLLS